MACFISAGHHLKDSGAISRNFVERDEMITFRNLIVPMLKALGVKVIVDDDRETLSQYLERIKTGEGSVVVEFHLNASTNREAGGALAVVGNDADRLDKMFAQELANVTSIALGIQNRGVMVESDTHRGRLGLMREQGIVSLLEICFISNDTDMFKFKANQSLLAINLASVIKKYDDMVL